MQKPYPITNPAISNLIVLLNTGNNRYQIKAIVKASGAYGVNINLDFNNDRLKIDHYCTCSSGSKLCEHAAAAIYKFISDDLPKLNPTAIKPAQPEGIEQLKLAAAASVEKATLSYKISGLDNQTENFTIDINHPRQVMKHCLAH